jgi:protoporphyrinogen/coproporphyrinogen III oxidase
VTTSVPALVIGGGISGLVCAYALRKAGVEVQLIEASSRLGGIIRSEWRNGFLLELGPQSFSGTAPLRGLCSELDVESQLVHAPSKAPRFVLVGGKLQAVPLSPPAFIGSPLFSRATKWSIARDLLGKTYPPHEDESIAAFVRRKFSAELLDKLVGPFVSGIYAGDPELLSVRSAFPQLYEAEKSAGSVIRGMMRAAKSKSGNRGRPTLLSFREGNETLIRALASRLGSSLRTGVEATHIALSNQGSASRFKIALTGTAAEGTITTDRLILATSTEVAARLFHHAQPAFEQTLGGIEYAPLTVVSLGYRRENVGHSLDGFGFLVPRSAGLRVLGTVWNSSLFPNRAPDEHVLLTSFAGGATDPEVANLSPDELVNLVHREIAPLLAIARTPVFSNIQLYRRALPQYNLGHAARLTALENLRQQIPNLWFTGNYLRGPAIGACVDQSLAVADQILSRN